MSDLTATAAAHPNIAFIKYWGNQDDVLRIPVNGSLSMNLGGLTTRTRVTFDPALSADQLTLNHRPVIGRGLLRVSTFLDIVRNLAGQSLFAAIDSENNFPTGAGIASSAAAFAALAAASTRALGLACSERDLSRLARRGSGSACRSIPAGFVEWLPGTSDADSYALSVAPVDHWALVDCITLVETGPKAVGSTEGHRLAGSSPLQASRVLDTPRRLDICRQSIALRDFDALAEIIELDSNIMHAVMMTSTPPLFYWQPPSLLVMQSVTAWRKSGLPVCYTLDAGPNVHVICLKDYHQKVIKKLNQIPGVRNILVAHPGGATHITG